MKGFFTSWNGKIWIYKLVKCIFFSYWWCWSWRAAAGCPSLTYPLLRPLTLNCPLLPDFMIMINQSLFSTILIEFSYAPIVLWQYCLLPHVPSDLRAVQPHLVRQLILFSVHYKSILVMLFWSCCLLPLVLSDLQPVQPHQVDMINLVFCSIILLNHWLPGEFSMKILFVRRIIGFSIWFAFLTEPLYR